jgi:hypothetical protein
MKILAGTILLFLLGTMFFSLFHLAQGMDMTPGGMTDCPFMSQAEVICTMNLADHVGAWKSVFLAVAPTVILLLTFAGTVAFVAATAPNLIRKKSTAPLRQYRWLVMSTYTFSPRPLQDFFAAGILHPKVY